MSDETPNKHLLSSSRSFTFDSEKNDWIEFYPNTFSFSDSTSSGEVLFYDAVSGLYLTFDEFS